MRGTCKNCGADAGLHHYETGQCPLGGFEAAIGRKQEWSFMIFEHDDNSSEVIKTQAEKIAKLEEEKIEILTKVYGFVNVIKTMLALRPDAAFEQLNKLTDYLVSVDVSKAALAKPEKLDGG